ncbi:hypothetical protein SARC_07729 [Sphaeroforma arctica JP610]|uniref:Hydroxylamine reductase n=1 Tax=Sphaeroforma arctica JP610 TaxID=667725 RepID=A0A0L0FSX4_9EUKA|nr:hypothetical protein SARC_07729 [Sphaeroforma arctica JP610]KNC79890.1 hypothetical protein SARC_07729 [Sphaeroforma arctica JP610]|eukprot:XP_014153792.1 hypothetical protein SARC_07729 [Sphaeroforma arctica JP610]
MLIVFGSQTGTTESFAQIVLSFAKMRGIDNVRLVSGDAIEPSKLKDEKLIVFLTSTFYNGEFPDNMRTLWKYLQSTSDSFKDTQFCVFGLGNSTTKNNFCVAAKELSAQMTKLGGEEIVPPVYSDEYAEAGHETAFRPWMKSVWVKLTGSNMKMSLPKHYKVEAASSASATEIPTTFDTMKVVENITLTPAGHERPVHHITLSLPAGKTYKLTDHVSIAPFNQTALVERMAKRLGVALDDLVSITSLEETAAAKGLPTGKGISVRDVLAKHLDIAAPPTRSFLEGLSTLATNEEESKALEKLAEDMSAGNLYSAMTGGGAGRRPYSLADCLEEYTSIEITLDNLLGNIPTLAQRLYSICSAPRVSANQIELCVVLDQFRSDVNPAMQFQGVASGYLAGLKTGDVVCGNVCDGLLDLPADSSKSLVGVALGSGVAVFRAILQERELQFDEGQDVSRMRLYMGMRRCKEDFLFKEELEKFQNKGLLELIPAFSHDEVGRFDTPATKISEIPEKVAEYLNNGGTYVYCGLGGLVPLYHEEAIIHALAACDDGLTSETAYGVVEDLKTQNRWQVEAYSRDMDEDNTLKTLMDRALQEKPVADRMEGSKMFCFQCGQTNRGVGCTTVGVCGKSPNVAALQDLLIDNLKRLSWYAHRITKAGGDVGVEVNRYTLVATFSTLTNVNFDEARMLEFIAEAGVHTDKLMAMYDEQCKANGTTPDTPSKRATKVFKKKLPKNTKPEVADIEDMVAEGKKVGVLTRFRAARNDALVGLQEMLVYGLKGLCAYTDHSLQYGNERPELYAFVHEAFAFLLSNEASDLGAVLGMLMKCGEINLISLKLLHDSNNTHGEQSPGVAKCLPQKGKAILVSGHDLKILGDLLNACAEHLKKTGVHVNVYTHGEMLPAHGYPNLRASPHLAAHYGWAWQRQSVEFGHFPGPILMTTNCLTKPQDEYKDRMFTAGAVGWPGIAHLGADEGYKVLIDMACELKGFGDEKKFGYPENPFAKSTDNFNVGWGQETVIGAAGTVLDQVGKGNISRFYVIGGCDGYEGERSYYTDLAKALPDTSVVLTVGCGKFRLNHLQFGTIGDTGIPRLLDLGQCNDSYSAVQIALALAGALDCGVNDLPLSIVLSWFEQKAVVVLLSLLSLGIQNIRVGPTVPAFLRPSIMAVLKEKFNLMAIGADVNSDIEKMVAGDQ